MFMSSSRLFRPPKVSNPFAIGGLQCLLLGIGACVVTAGEPGRSDQATGFGLRSAATSNLIAWVSVRSPAPTALDKIIYGFVSADTNKVSLFLPPRGGALLPG